MSNATQTPQVVLEAPVEVIGSSRTPQVVGMVVIDNTPQAPYSRTPQTELTVPISSDGVTRTSQQATLVVYGEGGRENFNLRAWAFFLDGNWYYVLHLGEEGTWIYCVATDTWAQFITEGYLNWNAEQGLVWNGYIVAGDNENGILWLIDPDTQIDDDFRPIQHSSTAFLPQSDRATTTVDGLWITASVGYPLEETPVVGLRFSDDFGQTWVEMTNAAVTLQPGGFSQEIAFRSLGTFGAPGRVFEVFDTGGPTRIDRAYVEVH